MKGDALRVSTILAVAGRRERSRFLGAESARALGRAVLSRPRTSYNTGGIILIASLRNYGKTAEQVVGGEMG